MNASLRITSWFPTSTKKESKHEHNDFTSGVPLKIWQWIGTSYCALAQSRASIAWLSEASDALKKNIACWIPN